MILVDSSVWIDFFNANPTPQALWLRQNLDGVTILVGDLILSEVLQGCRSTREFNLALSLMSMLPTVTVAGREVAIAAARNYRALREQGITNRRTIDGLIATRCIVDDLQLLHDDRDFDPFARHLGLQVVPSDRPRHPGLT